MSIVIEVWAPDRSDVAVVVEDQPRSATPDPARPGWFVGPELDHGADYLLRLHGENVPDPRARWMPAGVHGPSRVFDPTGFAWSDADWAGRSLSDHAIIYEMHVGTFTSDGTLFSARDCLPHLAELGVTHVEVMPLSSFDGDRGWGYDGVALNAVHEGYGGPTGLQAFVDAAHRAGLAVLLDVVHNHLGPSGNYWNAFGPFFTDRHTTPWGPAVNLDAPGSDDVRAILIDSVVGWLRDFHLDGLRLDAVHELRDDRARTFLEELSDAVGDLEESAGRPLSLIAESDRNDPRTVTARSRGGLGLTAQWSDDVHHALHWLLTGESTGYYADFSSCASVSKALTEGFLHDGSWSSFRGRSHGRAIDFTATPPTRFVAALQTHDQVGNRARGDRLTHLVDRDRLAAGAMLLMALPYTPMLFMGEEWGASTPWQFFTSFPEDLGQQVTQGRRREFQSHGWSETDVPDPQDPGTFRRSLLDWAERDRPESRRMMQWYGELIRWRPQIESGAPVECTWEACRDGRPLWWAVSRGRYLAVANLAGRSVTVPLAVPSFRLAVRASWTDNYRLVQEDGGAALELAAGESLVLEYHRREPTP